MNNQKSKLIVLDGETNGFVVFVNKQNKFVEESTQQKIPKLFTNFDLALSYVAGKLKIRNPLDYKIYLCVEGTMINFEDICKNSGYYEVYTDDMVYFVKENNTQRVVSIGYLVFDNGYNMSGEFDKKKAINRSKQLYKYCKDAVSNTIMYPFLNPTFKSMSKNKNGHLTISFVGTTLKMHICYNSQMVDLNVERKDAGLRCIPFDAAANKFLTMFVYFTAHIEDKDPLLKQNCNIAIDSVLTELKYIASEASPEYVPVQFKGVIELEDGVEEQ